MIVECWVIGKSNLAWRLIAFYSSERKTFSNAIWLETWKNIFFSEKHDEKMPISLHNNVFARFHFNYFRLICRCLWTLYVHYNFVKSFFFLYQHSQPFHSLFYCRYDLDFLIHLGRYPTKSKENCFTFSFSFSILVWAASPFAKQQFVRYPRL